MTGVSVGFGGVAVTPSRGAATKVEHATGRQEWERVPGRWKSRVIKARLHATSKVIVVEEPHLAKALHDVLLSTWIHNNVPNNSPERSVVHVRRAD